MGACIVGGRAGCQFVNERDSEREEFGVSRERG